MNNAFKLVIVLIFLISISSVNALDCQYKENETRQELEEGLYTESGEYYGEPLNFSDFKGGSCNLNGCTHVSFKVYNPLSFTIRVIINYTIKSKDSESRSDHFADISINQYSQETIIGNAGRYNILKDSIDYKILEPLVLIPKKEYVNKPEEICKICPNGKICLNDRDKCSEISEDSLGCGSGICNIAGFCGKEFIVDCKPYRLKNCNNEFCLKPSIREIGETYSCEWECISGRGENNICLESEKDITKGWIYWIIGIIFIVILGILLIYWKIWKGVLAGILADIKILTDRLDTLNTNIKDLEKDYASQKSKKEKELQKLEETLQKLDRELEKKEETLQKLDEKLQNQEDEYRKEVNYWKEKKKNAKGEAEKRIKEKIEENHKAFEKVKKEREKYDRERLQVSKARKKLKKEKENLRKEKEKPYKNKDGCLVHINDDGYEVFEDSGKLFHIWKYKKYKGKIPKGYEIHHKDGNKLNNDIDNLEAIPEEEHKKLHGNTKS